MIKNIYFLLLYCASSFTLYKMIQLVFDDKPSRREILNKILLESRNITLPVSGNILIKSENFTALSLLLNHYRERIDLVYIDPPFNTMQDFFISDRRANSVSSVKEHRAYTDKMTPEKFLAFMYERLIIIHELLSVRGSLYLHIDCKTGHYVKIILDEIFGTENFINDIARIKSNPKNFYRRAWGNERDMILFYAKDSRYNIWNDIKDSINSDELARRFPKIDSQGRRYTTIPLHAPGETRDGVTGQAWRNIPVPEGRHWRTDPAEFDRLDSLGLIEWSKTGNPRIIKYADEHNGKKIQDVWTFKDPQNPVYPTEKNHDMLKLIIAQSSLPESIILDCFAGSGASLLCASELGRHWIGIDKSKQAINIMRKNLTCEYAFIELQ
ncbi:MAG: site-specific DNA-methyltransferase [Synergistaceae bacterium]|nr:site-specific DNA-methyltransferase [Synergistaceae bacterium]